MTTKKDLQDRWYKLQTETLQLKKEIEELNESSEDELWELKDNELFYYVDYDGDIEFSIYYASSQISTDKIRFGNAFQTKEEAERHAKRVRTFNRLHRIATFLNDGWEPDHKDSTPENYYLVYLSHSCEFVVYSHSVSVAYLVYFRSRELAFKALDYLDEQDKAVLRGEV